MSCTERVSNIPALKVSGNTLAQVQLPKRLSAMLGEDEHREPSAPFVNLTVESDSQ